MFNFLLFCLIMSVITSDITIVKYISNGAYVCQQPWAMNITPSIVKVQNGLLVYDPMLIPLTTQILSL